MRHAPKVPREVVEDVHRRYLGGLSVQDVCAELGVTASCWYRYLHNYGLPKRDTLRDLRPGDLRLDILHKRWQSGETLGQLAKPYGLSASALRARFSRSGLCGSTRRRNWSPEVLRELRERYDAGWSVDALAAEVGATRIQLHAAWQRHDMTAPQHRWTLRQLRALAMRRLAGERLCDLSAESGIPQQSLYQAWDRHGIEYRGPETYHASVRRRYTDAQLRRAYMRRNDGATWPQVAESLGANGASPARMAVLRWAARHELPPPRRRGE